MRLAHLYLREGARTWSCEDITNPRAANLAVLRGDDGYFWATSLWPEGPDSLQKLIAADSLPQLQEALRSAEARGCRAEPLDSRVGWAPAVLRPPQIVAVGLNYAEHSAELSLERAKDPTLFSYWLNSLTGHSSEIHWPASLSEQIDYEAELGVIIGRPARNVPESEALDYVFGYTVVNDVTARDRQLQDSQWVHAKSFDTFTPVGPVVVTADQVPDPQSLSIRCRLNGQLVQNSNTGHMIFSVAQLIAYLSAHTTLLPGTLISTGSPGGSGRSYVPPRFLKDGDLVEVEIEKVGLLRNHCRVLPG